jgi:hypothetical protein
MPNDNVAADVADVLATAAPPVAPLSNVADQPHSSSSSNKANAENKSTNNGNKPKKMTDAKKSDIFSRLNDPKNYTGAHKSRFDDSGKGRGLDGRDMGNESKVTDLSQLTRASLRKSGTAEKRKTIDLSNVQKFGTQAEKAKTILVYSNGDINSHGSKVLLGKAINSWDKLLVELSKALKLPTGPCKKIYQVEKGAEGNTHKKITKLEQFVDGEIYLGCGAEDIIKDKYPKELEQ